MPCGTVTRTCSVEHGVCYDPVVFGFSCLWFVKLDTQRFEVKREKVSVEGGRAQDFGHGKGVCGLMHG